MLILGLILLLLGFFLDISIQLLLPFLLGQLAHNFLPRVREIAASKATKIVDRGSIWMVVYSAFSQGVVAGVWTQLPLWQILFLIVFSAALVVATVLRSLPGSVANLWVGTAVIALSIAGAVWIGQRD